MNRCTRQVSRPGLIPILCFIVGFLGTVQLGAQQVDRQELEKVAPGGIVFINYDGPQVRNETIDEIRSIGVELGSAVKAGSRQVGARNRYFVIHSISELPPEKLNADILGLGVDCGVDHIRNLRFIIQGYLESAYGYSANDARLLAEFITIYNAVYRGNFAYFQGRYKDAVLTHLSKEKAGLSVRYDEWPGQALIVIPLAMGRSGSLSAVSTTPLTEGPVVEQLRQQGEQGVETRQNMVEMKEREADQASQSAQLQQEAIRAEEQRIAAEKRALQEEQARIAAEEQRIAAQRAEEERRRATGTDTRTEAERQAAETAIQSAEREVEERKEAAAETAAAITQAETQVEEAREEQQAAEQLAETKTEEAQQERAEIAQDQQQAIDNAAASEAAVLATSKPALMLVNQSSSLARLLLINPADKKEVKRSATDTIHARTVQQTSNGIIAIADGNGTSRLVAFDPLTLEIIRQGDQDLHPESLLWQQQNSIYAVALSGGKYYFARFDQQFKRMAISVVEVHPYCTPFFAGDQVSVQRPDGSPVMLGSADLIETK